MDFIQQYFAMVKQAQEKLIQWTDINTKNQKKEYFFQLQMRKMQIIKIHLGQYKDVLKNQF